MQDARLCPLPLPDSVLRDQDARAARVEADPLWAHEPNVARERGRWLQEYVGWARAGSGRGYALANASYWPDRKGTAVVTLFGADFHITAQVALDDLTGEHEYLERISVLSTGDVVISTTRGRLWVFNSELSTLHKAYPPSDEGACLTQLTRQHSGRVFGVSIDHTLYRSAGEGISLAKELPAMESLGRIYDENLILLSGERPGVIECLGDDRVLVPQLALPMRSGNSRPCYYVVLDRHGEQVGLLPLDDDPTLPRRFPHTLCLAHGPLDGWVMRTEKAFHVFDRDGGRDLRAALDDRRLSPLRKLQLFGVGHAGELVFLHPEQHTLLVTAPVTKLEALEPSLEAAAAIYRSAHRRLKKAAAWNGDVFTKVVEPVGPA